ncbi:hypothetical protein [Labilibaculum euxinus]|uniref:DUF4398 domain-containing protein n=1 Tax=Labilibaculum euxinus TaxID=2686357 RepID=A0A7M4D525_9BACT|nr:hypothetical protein [Labilibaculum euxinus]MUP37754.1 hypothetical protein [Labilibaculum euxinus]MVB06959.1 hypothetical protein [Labilibaculum euxinus]
MKKKLLFVLAVGTTVLFSSCGKVPQVEIDCANAAIEVAKSVGANVYVAEDFAALQDSMRSVNENVEVQNAKFFKNFDHVKAQLVVLNAMVVEVKDNAEARKEEVKLEIDSLQAEVDSIVMQNKELTTQAPKGKEGVAALEAIKGDISLIEASLIDVAGLVSQDQLIVALDKVKAAKEKALEINTELNEVIAKYAKNKRK